MLKGINHQMIELAAMESPYFERAFFVLKSDCVDHNVEHLQEEARRMLRAAGGYTALDRNRRRARYIRWLWGVSGAFLGILFCAILFSL